MCKSSQLYKISLFDNPLWFFVCLFFVLNGKSDNLMVGDVARGFDWISVLKSVFIFLEGLSSPNLRIKGNYLNCHLLTPTYQFFLNSPPLGQVCKAIWGTPPFSRKVVHTLGRIGDFFVLFGTPYLVGTPLSPSP